MKIIKFLKLLRQIRKAGQRFSFSKQIALRPEDKFQPSYTYCISSVCKTDPRRLYPAEVVYCWLHKKKPTPVGLSFSYKAIGISAEDGSLLTAAGEEYVEEEPTRKKRLQQLRRDLLLATGLEEVPLSAREKPFSDSRSNKER